MFNFNFKKIFIIFVVSLNFGITNTVFCMKKENEKKLTNQSSKKNLKPIKKQSKTIENKPTCTSKKQTDIHPKKNLSKAKPKISSTSKKTTIPKKSVNATKEQTTLLKDITQTTKKIDKKAKEKNLKNIKINSEEPKTKNLDNNNNNNNIEKINNCILKFSPLGLMHDSYDDSLIGTWEMLRKTGVYSIYNNFNKATNILNDDKTFRDSNGCIIGKWEKRANDKFYIESNENINTC